MNNESLLTPLSHTLAETLTNRHPKRYNDNVRTINQELLGLMARVGMLESRLTEEQGRKELLLEENGGLRERLQRARGDKGVREVRLKQLSKEAERHQMKNREMQECESNMNELYREINDLKVDIKRKEDNCQQISQEIPVLQGKKQELELRKKDLKGERRLIQDLIGEYLKNYPEEYDSDSPNLDDLSERLNNLLTGIETINIEEDKIKRDHSKAIHRQKELEVKLEYELKLLRQRVVDYENNQQIAKICQTHSNLDQLVENMLAKEDELLDQLKILEEDYQSNQKHFKMALHDRQERWAEEKLRYEGELKGLRMSHEQLMNDSAQLGSQVGQKKQKRQRLSVEYELMHRLHLNFNSMQKLRQVQQRNNYLKLKIRELSEIKNLLLQQKQLIPTARFF